ncbi:MAG: hypothetical protein JO020_24785 [Chloroflexi bacterium]|nr:hypothetical protein [Chloroflexota bacterium]MBV9897388.1 hypothetical protein [Chloroflexota bacterium]
MQRSRIIITTAIALGVLFAQLLASSSAYGTNAPMYAIDATPSPTTAQTGSFTFATPTPVLLSATAVAAIQATGATGATSGAQQSSDQIASVSQQVTQAVQDQSLSIDAKVQRITSLAAQFNQLVAQWQQQLLQTSTAPAAAATPLPTAAIATPLPVPTAVAPVAGGTPTADQLRAQIATISQQMAQISQDPTLSADTRAQKLSALATQFNQLMAQLPQP